MTQDRLMEKGPGHASPMGEEVLEAVLRGAAKLLGCSSASLIFLDQEAQVLRVRVGLSTVANPTLTEVESLLGSIREIYRPLEAVRESLLYTAWKDRVVVESSSLSQVAGGAFPSMVLRALERLIGDHRFVAVPVLVEERPVGLALFEKVGRRPFSPQQREVMLRYAQRLGEILRRDRFLWQEFGTQGDLLLLVNPQGRVVGGNRLALALGRDSRRSLARWAAERLGDPGDSGQEPPEPGGARAEGSGRWWYRVRVRGEDLVLVRVPWSRPDGLDPRDRWMRLALGERQATVMLNPDLSVTSCNADAELLFGAEVGGLLERPFWDLFPSREAGQGLLNRQMLLDPGARQEVVTFRRLDGSLFAARVEMLLLADGEGRSLGFLMGIREALDEEWEANTSALMGKERLVTMGQMAAQMAHEIRNPLLAIGATLQVLSREEGMDAESRGMLTAAAAEITRLDMLLKDYLSLAVRHGAIRAPLDLAEAAREVVALLRHSPKALGRTLEIRVPEPLEVNADPDGLRHVLFNLALNALEATGPGGRVVIGGRREDREVVLEVEDDGVGLPPMDPEALFEPFVSTKRHGTGLGLSVVRQVVQAHDGKVRLEPRAGGGTRALVWLPGRDRG